MLGKLTYVVDEHRISVGEAAYTRFTKAFVPNPANPIQVLAVGFPVQQDMPVPWVVYSLEAQIYTAAGLKRRGIAIKLFLAGPPNHGGTQLCELGHDSYNLWSDSEGMPCSWGLGYEIYNQGASAAMVATDLVICRGHYKVGVK
jgi:hypothetical protein